jgi:hypothetical protein
MPAGRPSDYTPEIAEEIFRRLANGESLKAICEDDHLPSRETVRHWLFVNPEFLGNYARAREEQAEHYADEIIEIADTETDANIARVRIDARKWKAARMAPRKWGDKVINEHGGTNGAAIEHKVTVEFVGTGNPTTA